MKITSTRNTFAFPRALALLYCAALAACSAPVTPVPRPVVVLADLDGAQTLDQVVCLDPELVRLDRKEPPFLVIERHGASRSRNGTLAASARFSSRIESPLVLEVRSTFYDAGGGPVDSQAAAWQRLFLAPLATQDYASTSLSDRAAHYYIEVRLTR